MFDVIIIGAGPSGSSCAYNLKRNYPAAKVLLLDKSEFPRYKPCGGGVSPEVANYLDFDLIPGVDSICNEVVMVANGRQIMTENYPLWMVRREVFDNYLLSQAKEAGVEFCSGCEVADIQKNNDGNYQVLTITGNLFAKIVVIAEGGRGKLAKKLGIAPKNNILAAMEYEHYTTSLDGKLYIDFDYNDSGYAWNFPKSDGLSLGIGGLIKGRVKGAGLPKKLTSYAKQLEVDKLIKEHLHGHPIELYSGKQKLVYDRIILIGEIAGCVDPLTAEGIRPAIKSGYLAAKSIVLALKNNDLGQVKSYSNIFHEEIGKDMQRARLMSYFLNQYMQKVLPMLSNEAAVRGFMQVFSGQSSYTEKINLRRVLKLVTRSLWG